MKQIAMLTLLLGHIIILLLVICGIGAIFPEGDTSQLVSIISILYLGVSGVVFLNCVDMRWKVK